MKELKDKRIVISGLLSAKINTEEFLDPIRIKINESGGRIIEEFIQRRGVSRSNKPGGSKHLHLPLSGRTIISTGKAEELKELVRKSSCDLVVFVNELNSNQHEILETIIGVDVIVIY